MKKRWEEEEEEEMELLKQFERLREAWNCDFEWFSLFKDFFEARVERVLALLSGKSTFLEVWNGNPIRTCLEGERDFSFPRSWGTDPKRSWLNNLFLSYTRIGYLDKHAFNEYHNFGPIIHCLWKGPVSMVHVWQLNSMESSLILFEGSKNLYFGHVW